MKNVVAYSLFTSPAPRAPYVRYLPVTIAAARAFFPGWEIWVYHDGKTATDWLCRAAKAGLVRLFEVPPMPLCRAMLWRLRPLFDRDVGAVLCRDFDAVATPREGGAVREWMASSREGHVIHDADAHFGVMGGTLGLRQAVRVRIPAPRWETWVRPGADWETHGEDQLFLNREMTRLRVPLLLHQFRGRVPLAHAIVRRAVEEDLPAVPWSIGAPVSLETARQHLAEIPAAQGALAELDRLGPP